MSGNQITLYVDIISPFTFFAFHILESYRKIWDIEVEYVPIVIGIVMKEAGNKPPISVKAKGEWMDKDIQRTVCLMGLGQFSRPAKFPFNTMKMMRILTAMKLDSSAKGEDFNNSLRLLWRALFTDHVDLEDVENIKKAMSAAISTSQVERYVSKMDTKEVKDTLIRNTKEALGQGSFGLPWMKVTRAGEKQPEFYFGSDRWHQIADFLGKEWKGYEPVKYAGTDGGAKL